MDPVYDRSVSPWRSVRVPVGFAEMTVNAINAPWPSGLTDDYWKPEAPTVRHIVPNPLGVPAARCMPWDYGVVGDPHQTGSQLCTDVVGHNEQQVTLYACLLEWEQLEPSGYPGPASAPSVGPRNQGFWTMLTGWIGQPSKSPRR